MGRISLGETEQAPKLRRGVLKECESGGWLNRKKSVVGGRGI